MILRTLLCLLIVQGISPIHISFRMINSHQQTRCLWRHLDVKNWVVVLGGTVMRRDREQERELLRTAWSQYRER